MLFRIGFEFAGTVLNKYWILKPHLRRLADAYVEREFKDSYVIGIQIRWLHGYLEDEDIEVFVRCAQSIELDLDFERRESVKWYLSTDELELFDTLRERRNNNTKKKKKTVLSGIGKFAVWTNPSGNERLLFDIEMLSRCDDVILTGGSTFGFIGVMKSQRIPYYVEGGRSMKRCDKFQFSRPPRTPAGDAIF